MAIRKAGIDIGSRTIKLVVVEEGEVVVCKKTENSFDTIGDCRRMLDGVGYDTITATGYGRYLFAEHFEDVKVISEIKAFTIGVHHLFPDCRTILDIGGQDTKAISLSENGSIKKFEMNDKCAAGTGRFLEVMAMSLRYSLAEFGEKAMLSEKNEKINCMCTVFAESEVVSMLAKGARREDVAKGIMQSVVTRAASLLRRVGVDGSVVFVGGVALNGAMGLLLEENLGCPVHTPDDPQIIGALGAAFNK